MILKRFFDPVSRRTLFRILSRLHSGEILVEGVTFSYRGSSVRPIVSNVVSNAIHDRSFVRQSCPLSPLLFTCYLEPLCHSALRSPQFPPLQSEEVQGQKELLKNAFEQKLAALEIFIDLTNAFDHVKHTLLIS